MKVLFEDFCPRSPPSDPLGDPGDPRICEPLINPVSPSPALTGLAASGSPDRAVTNSPHLPSSCTIDAARGPAGQQARHEAFMQSAVSSQSLDADTGVCTWHV